MYVKNKGGTIQLWSRKFLSRLRPCLGHLGWGYNVARVGKVEHTMVYLSMQHFMSPPLAVHACRPLAISETLAGLKPP